jgi:hypothetical protein
MRAEENFSEFGIDARLMGSGSECGSWGLRVLPKITKRSHFARK